MKRENIIEMHGVMLWRMSAIDREQGLLLMLSTPCENSCVYQVKKPTGFYESITFNVSTSENPKCERK